jgi:small subunit ribosomal protein S36
MSTEPDEPVPVTERHGLRRRVGRALRAVPLLVWLVVGLHVSIMGTYSLLSLPYTQGDEAQNHDMVVAWLHGDGLTPPGERQLAVGVLEGHQRAFSAYRAPPFSDHDPGSRRERPTRGELGGDRPTTGELPNQMTQHPPLYFALLAGILYAVPGDGGWAWDQGVGFLRMINVLLLAPLPLLAWAAVRPLTRSAAAPIAAAIVPLLIPGVARVGGSINHDNLLTLLGCILTVLLVHVCLGNLRLRLAAAVGITIGLALLTKGFALAFPPVVALAYLVGWRRAGGRFPWKTALIAQLIAFAVGGWWWVANLVRFGAVQPNGYGQEGWVRLRGPKIPASVPRDHGEFVQGVGERLGNWTVAFLGRLEPPFFPFRLALVVFAVLGLGLMFSLFLRRRAGLSPGVVGVCVLPIVGIFIIIVKGAYSTWNDYLVIGGVQGRYLYPGIVGAAVVTAVGWAALLSGARRWLPAGLLVLAGVVQFVAANIVVDTYWLPPGFGGLRPDHLRDALAQIDRWSPWPVALSALPFVGIIGFGAATVIGAVRFGLRGDQDAALDAAPEHVTESRNHEFRCPISQSNESEVSSARS